MLDNRARYCRRCLWIKNLVTADVLKRSLHSDATLHSTIIGQLPPDAQYNCTVLQPKCNAFSVSREKERKLWNKFNRCCTQQDDVNSDEVSLDCSTEKNSCVFGPVHQCCGLRPWSYDKTGLRPVPVLVLVLQFRSWSWSWSWSEHFGLVSNSENDQ